MKEKKYIKIDIPDNVSLIIKELEKKGFEAFAVGGCVRDAILKKKPNDWDITTSASPMDIKSVFLKRKENSLEDFYINRFGNVLYNMFFEKYTENPKIPYNLPLK